MCVRAAAEHQLKLLERVFLAQTLEAAHFKSAAFWRCQIPLWAAF